MSNKHSDTTLTDRICVLERDLAAAERWNKHFEAQAVAAIAERDRLRAALDTCQLWHDQVAPFGQESAGHESDEGWCISCGGGWPCAAVLAEKEIREALAASEPPKEPEKG